MTLFDTCFFCPLPFTTTSPEWFLPNFGYSCFLLSSTINFFVSERLYPQLPRLPSTPFSVGQEP